MTLAPLRSAMSFGAAEDTSLALPSDNKPRSGQQRVLEQVHTIKRSKSKQSTNGSLSPKSPAAKVVFSEFSSFKFSPTKVNGSVFNRSNSVAVTGSSTTQQHSRTLSTRSPGRKQVQSNSQWEQRFQVSNRLQPTSTNGGLKPSRSDLSLEPSNLQSARGQSASMQSVTLHASKPPRASLYSVNNNRPAQVISSQTQVAGAPSNQSQVEAKVSVSKTKTEVSGVNGTASMPDITMKEAVEYLSNQEENYQLCGASFIQHSTFREKRAKQEVLRLNGIPPLVALLRSQNAQIQQTAAAALRNLVFKDNDNKLEVERCSGIDEALALLRDTSSTETQKQLTGLLWNLSSADELKAELIKNALPVLTESIVVPYTCWSDGSPNNNVDPEVFYSATGCMRNLSCAKEEERQAMRDCRGLIDSLITYVQSCVAADRPDDKSVENCVCILHNLTYQLETEAAEHFAKFSAPVESTRDNVSKKSSTIGCFSPKSNKIQKEFDFPQLEESEPKGVGWLYHSKAMQMYLSLLSSSQKDATLEACCGALQNLTANKGQVSSLMSQTIVQKLKGLPHISPMLQATNPSLQKTAMSLVGNLTRTPSLQSNMARQILPELSTLLSAGAKHMGNSDNTMATACQTARSLLMAAPEMGRKVLNISLVNSLSGLSGNGYFPKASKAAALLLHSMWAEKDIQSFLKKQGMSKATFVNEITTSAHKSVQVIDG